MNDKPSMKNWHVHSVIYGLGQITNDPPFHKKKKAFLGSIEVKYFNFRETFTYSIGGVPIGCTYPTCQILKTSNWQTHQMDKYFGINSNTKTASDENDL